MKRSPRPRARPHVRVVGGGRLEPQPKHPRGSAALYSPSRHAEGADGPRRVLAVCGVRQRCHRTRYATDSDRWAPTCPWRGARPLGACRSRGLGELGLRGRGRTRGRRRGGPTPVSSDACKNEFTSLRRSRRRAASRTRHPAFLRGVRASGSPCSSSSRSAAFTAPAASASAPGRRVLGPVFGLGPVRDEIDAAALGPRSFGFLHGRAPPRRPRTSAPAASSSPPPPPRRPPRGRQYRHRARAVPRAVGLTQGPSPPPPAPEYASDVADRSAPTSAVTLVELAAAEQQSMLLVGLELAPLGRRASDVDVTDASFAGAR